MLAALVFLLGVFAAPGEDPAAPQPSPHDLRADNPGLDATQKEEFSLALLATRDVDQAALLTALAMRVPQLEIRTQWNKQDAQTRVGTIFLDIHLARRGTQSGALILVDIVLRDGRAYRRQLNASPDDARIIASFVSNLLLSIEEQAVEADREGVEIPETSAQLDVARVVEKLDTDQPAAPLVPAQPKVHETPEVPKAATRWLPWELNVGVTGQLHLAAGPPSFADTVGGGGASVVVSMRKDNGLLFDFDLRFLGEGKTGASMLRVRGALGAGYEWRRGAFALPTSLAYTLEGYRVDYGNAPITALDLSAPPLLNGLRLRSSPTARIPLDRGPLRTLRIGVRGELAGSFGIDDGPRVLGIRRGEAETGNDELFRLGGLELGIGIEIGADFGLRRPE